MYNMKTMLPFIKYNMMLGLVNHASVWLGCGSQVLEEPPTLVAITS